MEWATAHFQPCVTNLSGVTTEGRDMHDLHAYAHDRGLSRARGWPGRGCRDKPPGVICRDREFSVAIEIAHPVSRRDLLCHDRDASVRD